MKNSKGGCFPCLLTRENKKGATEGGGKSIDNRGLVRRCNVA